MQFAATPDNERFLHEQVAAGAFASPDEALNEAVRLLERRDRLRREIDEGIVDLEEGRFVELDSGGLQALFDRLRARARS